jgi:hypothetical protein
MNGALFCPPVKGESEPKANGGFAFKKTNPPLAFGSRPPCQGVKA